MDLSKTPSLQSLVESDIGSVDSLHSLNIEELDEAEYALPTTAEPTLAELLDEPNMPTDNSALQVELLQALSQQLKSAEERSEAGAATTLAIGGPNGEWVATGTAHGHVLAFAGGAQTLRWACGVLREGGAVAALAYCAAGARLLVAHARGTVAQREARSGRVLRRVALGGGAWGALAVAWAGAAGLALDTGGSVWLLRFSRPLGVRTTRPSCLFSGARGEVVCMSARDGRVVALATLQRVVVVAGARAAAVPLRGPAHFLPLLAWRAGVLCCARATTLLWVAANATRGAVELRVLRRVEVRAPLIWLGWLDARLALLDSSERLRLFDDEEDDAAADVSFVEPVYASAFFKGVWTEGRVSGALAAAGASALGGAASGGGALLVLGRAGVVRARAAGARALAARGRWARALRAAAPHERAALLASLAAEPRALRDPATAAAAVQLCLRHQLREELWGELWESGGEADELVWAVGEAAAEGALEGDMAPPPAAAQLLVQRLADTQPSLLERALLALPLTCLDPHQASGLAHRLGLWRAAAALAEALGGGREAAARELGPLVERCRAGGGAGACRCPGDALLLRAADGLAGRGPRGALPAHAQPALRHETLGALLAEEGAALRTLLAHDARSCCRLLEMAFPEPPFVGPLGRQNKLRVARALLNALESLPHEEDRVEVAHFVATQLGAGALPVDPELLERVRSCAAGARGRRADAAWLAVLSRVPPPALPEHLDLAVDRPRVRRRILALLGRREEILDTFLEGDDESQADEMLEYLQRCAAAGDGALRDALARRVSLVARAAPAALARLLVAADWRDLVPAALAATRGARRLAFSDELLELGALEGEAAREHLRMLCAHRPGSVLNFLSTSPGIVRPEEALEFVRRHGATDAEPHCLEALGDAEGALAAALHLVEAAEEEESRRALASRACELCARLASGAPPAAAAALWGRFVACEAAVRRVAAGSLLESAAHVPVGTLVEHVCGSSGGARLVLLALLRGASGRAVGAGAASRILSRELHAALARALKGSGRAVRVRAASCEACRWPLEARAPVRCYPCGHAAHVACGTAERCARCECAAEREVRALGAPRRCVAPRPPALPCS